VELPSHQFDGLAIEGELAVRIGQDIPSATWLRQNPDVIDGHRAVIELHNYVFRGPESIRAVELIANNAIHAGVVVANEELPTNKFAPEAIFSVSRNTECLGEGTAEHLANGTLEIVASVAQHLQQFGRQLRRDQIILTGSPLPLWPVEPGDHIRASFGDHSTASCTVAPQDNKRINGDHSV
jgi:2-oxopent-4-enoate/cis-2-oxohex-4-enoate hydratase